MQQNYSRIQTAGFGLAAISYDSPQVLKNFADRHGITFPLLSDSNSKIIRSFGILNDKVDPKTPQFGIPNPGIYYLDRHGIVKAKYFEDDYRERQTAAAILMREFGIMPATPHVAVAAKHLSLTASASTEIARMGQHISLLLDLTLPPRVHVYAPGVQGYISIAWTQAETPAARSHDAVFPEAQTLFLPAIKEKVPVYQGHFQLSREVVLGSDKDITPLLDQQKDLVLHGLLRYQACDDEQCYLPETVPVSWKLHFLPLDRERVPKELQRQ